MKNYLLAGIACLLFAATASSQSIQVNHYALTTAPNLHEFNALRGVYEQDVFEESFFALIQFNRLPNATIRKEISAATGIHFLGSLPHDAYYVRIPKGMDVAPLFGYEVKGLYRILPEYKISPELTSAEPAPWAMHTDETIDLNLVYYSLLDQKKVIEALKASGIIAVPFADWVNVLKVTIPFEQLHEIAALPFLQYIEPEYRKPEPDNHDSRPSHRNNWLSSDYNPLWYYDGTGTWVGINDDGEIGPHIDFQGRLDQSFVENDDEGDHGDHTSGIVGAAGNLEPRGRGNAFGANIKVYHAYDDGNAVYEGFYDVPLSYANPGVIANSTSYSDGCNVGYTSLTQTVDEAIFDHKGFMHVFSAGNSSSSGCNGIGGKFLQITGGHKAGKNCLTTGNVTKVDALNSSSSGGPMKDGRLKPELCAVGTDVYSTYGPNDYDYLTGTSMACPGLAGTFAAMTHAYREITNTDEASSALIKAILMNTADDLGNTGPDYQFGYGRVNSRRALRVLENENYLIDSIDEGGEKDYIINVPAGVKQLRVIIYWHDPVASLGVEQDLVNDLRMRVIDPVGGTFDPWILSVFPQKDSLDLPAIRGLDTLNNHEQVTIDDPVSPGDYTIKINGSIVPEGPQHYVIVYEFLFDELTLVYPNGGESWVPNEDEYVRWDSYGPSEPFKLEISTDAGASWTLVQDNIDSTDRIFKYEVPDVVTGKAVVRISRGSLSDEGNYYHSIIDVPTNLQIDTICPSGVKLMWNAVSGASGYEVYKLGAKYMESVGTTTTNSFSVPGLNIYVEDWLSVRALGPDSCLGRRAAAIEKSLGLLNCILSNDVSITEITPADNTFTSCMDVNTIPVTATLANDGLLTASGFNVNFQLDAGTIVTEPFTGTLLSGTSAVFNFSATIDLSAAGSHVLDVWLSFIPDENPYNDSASSSITVGEGTIVTLPFYESFETFSLCGTDNNCEDEVCVLANGWLNPLNLQTDDIDWRTNFGATPGNNTGPDQDFDSGTPEGKYLYLEASGCTFREAQLLTPCIDLTTATLPRLTYAYHMYGSKMGDLHLDVFTDGAWTNDITPAIVGDQGNLWFPDTIDLSAFLGKIITVRFRGVTGTGALSDMAVDAIGVYDAAPLIAGFTIDGALCTDSVITYTSSSVGDIISYSWDFGANASPANATTEGPHNVAYSAPGLKTVALNITSISGSDVFSSDITINPTPVADFDFTVDAGVFQFDNTSSNATGYLWDFGDGNISTDEDPVHEFDVAGTYVITLTATGICGTSTVTETVVFTSAGLVSTSGVMVYPNPSDDIFYVSLPEFKEGLLTVSDITGRKLLELPADNSTVALDLSHYADGVYMLRIRLDEEQWYVKLVKE